ncbi:MAG TPA: amino acid ABC transporter substrate-binding protein [Nocardioides sp.]|nr:amino acid ABC transporter substrate-binding protein [Nocardioides sp.]
MSRVRLALTSAVAGVALALSACSASSSGGGSAAGTLASVKDAGVLVVGTEGTYKPFSYHDEGTGDLTGFDVDVIRAVGAELGVKVEFKETQWDAIFAGLDAKRFDVIANQVSINPERQAKYEFSTPYTYSPGVVVTRADDDSIHSFTDLAGKTTAQSLTSNWYDVAKADGAKVQSVEGWAQAIKLLQQGRVDAVVNDRLTFLDWANTAGDGGLKIAATSDDVSENAVAFRKGSDTLVAAVDKALAHLAADGTLAKISKKYFGADVTHR